MRKFGLFLVAAVVAAFFLAPLLAFGQVPDAGAVVQPLPGDPVQLAVRAVDAAATNDWRVLAVAVLALLGFLVRNVSSAEGKLGAFLHSKWGALLVSAVSASIGAAVPALQGGVALRGVVVSAMAGAAGALCGWLTPAPAVKATAPVVALLAMLSLGGCARESAMEAGAMACAFVAGAVGAVLVQRLRARFLWCLLVAVCLGSVTGCGASTKTIVATAAIATVQTVDQGIETFTTWAVHEEDRIASAAIAACSDRRTLASYKACTDESVTPRRAPIDKAKSAIRIYRQALAAGGAVAAGDLANAAAAVLGALAAVGIAVGGG